MLCGANSSARATLLDNLYNNNINTSYSMDNCPTVLKFTYNYKSFENLPSSLRTDTVNYGRQISIWVRSQSHNNSNFSY